MDGASGGLFSVRALGGFLGSLLIALALVPHDLAAEPDDPEIRVESHLPAVLRLEKVNHPSFIAAPPPPTGPGAQAARITVLYQGFSPAAQRAFQRAVDIWASQVTASVPIVVEARWEPQAEANILGSAGPYRLVANFPNAPRRETFYPIALANQMAGQDLAPSIPDIQASFNSQVTSWYFGTDGRPPPGQIDFVTTVLHELGHGLGFVGSAIVDPRGIGRYQPFIYDHFAILGTNVRLLSLPNNSHTLADALQGEDLFFDGANAVAAAGGRRPRLYAPPHWLYGSSFSHLDESTYPPGNPNSLMTPVLSWAEAIHDPGSITRGIFRDIGWVVPAPAHRLFLPLVARRASLGW